MEQGIIAAVATAKGVGSIAVLRLSGEGCWALLKEIFLPIKPMDWQKGFTLHYGHISYHGEVYDEVLVALMRKEASYTREEMARSMPRRFSCGQTDPRTIAFFGCGNGVSRRVHKTGVFERAP